MDKQVKVIKDINEFGFRGLRKGMVFTAGENGNGYVNKGSDENKSWFLLIDSETVENYIEEGYMIRLEQCPTCAKLKAVKERVEDMIKQYTIDHNNMQQAFENGEVQPCVKVEAETVYFNMIKILNNILDKINE